MPSTTDSELLALAEENLGKAQAILGLPSPETSVSGDAWDDLAERAAQLLKRAWELRPVNLGAKAAEKLRDAAKQGLNRASSAGKSARDTLQKVALGASLLGLSTLILPGLIVFAIVESSGAGKRLRGAGRRYVSARAREYGV